MKKILAIILVLCMVLGLAACGKKSESVQGSQEMSSGEAAANVNPTFINWGTRREVENSSDPWYPNGHIGTEFIYFAYGESSAGIVYYHEKDGAVVGQAACALTEDLCLVTEDKGEEVEIIFPSEFHAYDLKTETWYIRANPDFMMSLFVGKSFAEQNDSDNTLIFNADGTAAEVYQGSEYPGTWKIINATTIRFTISGEEYYDFDLVINGDNTLNSISEYGNRTFKAK